MSTTDLTDRRIFDWYAKRSGAGISIYGKRANGNAKCVAGIIQIEPAPDGDHLIARVPGAPDWSLLLDPLPVPAEKAAA